MSPTLNCAASVLSLLFLAGLVASQTNHIVQVGVQGSFYNPATISAQLNDTVTFVFGGAAHSVTQCAFETPCVPLPGGFNSGIAGTGANLSNPAPSWSLVITNVSQPIWFFCESTIPTSHCASGMVGVINPSTISDYTAFSAAAKLVSGTAPPMPAVTLSGIGAFATNSPTPTNILASSNTSTSTSTFTSTVSTPSSSSTIPTPPTPSSDSSAPESSFDAHKGGIIAGIVVGSVVIIILLLLLYFFLKRRHDQQTINHFFSYKVPAPRNMTMRSGSQLALPSNSNSNGEGTSVPARNGGSSTMLIVPDRRPSQEFDFRSGFGGRGHAYAGVGVNSKDTQSEGTSSDIYGSVPSSLNSGSALGGTKPPHTARRPSSHDRTQSGARREHRERHERQRTGRTGNDINSLAREVAAVLRQDGTVPPASVAPIAQLSQDQKTSPDGGNVDLPVREPSPAPPPVYHS